MKWKLFLSILLTMALSERAETGAFFRETGRLRQSVEDAIPLGAEVDDDDDDGLPNNNNNDDNVDDPNDEDDGSLMPDDDGDDDEDEEVEETGNEEVEATTNYTAAINETAAALKDLKNVDTKTLVKKPKKSDEAETNTHGNHCAESWSEWPCRLGWRHGCRNGICWKQCTTLPILNEWCWVQTEKAVNETGTADDSDWKYVSCTTDADCTVKKAYRKECQSWCTVGM